MRMTKKNNLICHIMHDMVNEVGIAKTKVYAQEFKWKKREWPIDTNAIPWIDKKGTYHLFVDVNESDGTIRFVEPQKTNLDGEPCDKCHSPIPLDKCSKCGDRITIDARNVRDLVKRKTIDTFWGLDSSHIMLLLIMGIFAIGAMGGLFYVIGQLQSTQAQLAKYLPAPTSQTSSATNAKFIMPFVEDILIVN